MRKQFAGFFIVMLLIIPYGLIAQQDIWTCKSSSLTFFSSAPIEDIKGVSTGGASALNTKTGEIIFKVKNTSFKFRNRTMQEHFNENYMESEQYPVSEFKGIIENVAVLSQPGKQLVQVSGKLNIHGVNRDYNTEAEVVVEPGTMTVTCSFYVRLQDHNIKIPSIVGRNIADKVKVDILATYKQ
jgi:hypothetical protein